MISYKSKLSSLAVILLILIGLGCAARPHFIVIQSDTVPPDVEQAQSLLQNVITACRMENAQIDYAKLNADEQRYNDLNAFLAWAAATTPQSASDLFDHPERRRCFYLNALIACTLRAVLEYYPIEKISDCPVDFYHEIRFTIAGEQLSISQCADKASGPADWRIEFALVDPAASGPFIPAEPYHLQSLDRQLDDAVTRYISSCAGIRIDHEKQAILFGRKIIDQRDRFINRYKQTYHINKNISLAAAIMPYANSATQQLLANVAGFKKSTMPPDPRLYQPDFDKPKDPDEEKKFLPCGCQ